MASFSTPTTFPDSDFRVFGNAAAKFFPNLVSDEALNDRLEKRRHFDWSWQAVRYRYRTCTECSEEFKALLDGSSAALHSDWDDEELTYRLERCIYVFFVSALSVFDSFAFCLYFFGNAIRPAAFPDIASPHKIRRSAVQKAMNKAFPHDCITGLLNELSRDERFVTLDSIRNLLAHRLSGRRTIRAWSTPDKYGTSTRTRRQEAWHIPGAQVELTFDKDLLQRHLADLTNLLSSLSAAARAFAQSQNSASTNINV